MRLTVVFPRTDWNRLQLVYGWAALQYQAWARGYVQVSGYQAQRISLFTDGVLEFWVNNEHYFGGDFYSFRRAPVVLTLLPGKNRIDVRLIRDVRLMGGNGSSMTVRLWAHALVRPVLIIHDSVLASDVVGGKLPSELASVVIRNQGDEWVEVIGCRTFEVLTSYQPRPPQAD